MRTLIFDLETDGLLHELSVVHCMAIVHLETGARYDFAPWNIEEGVRMLESADVLVGHNILAFDVPAIRKVFGVSLKAKLIDTQIYSKSVFGDGNDTRLYRMDMKMFKEGRLPGQLIGSHKLEAYGYRLGILKGEYGKKEDAWEQWTPEMHEYCKQDVEVTVALFERLTTKYSTYLTDDVLDLEHESAEILDVHQHDFGFQFNFEKAEELRSLCEKKQAECLAKLRYWAPTKVEPVYKKGELVIKTPARRSTLKAGPWSHSTEPGAAYCEVQTVEFNGTDKDIIKLLTRKYGWKPEVLTESGMPSTKAEHIEHLEYECIPYIMDLKVVKKVLGYVSTGKNAWLKLVGSDGIIRHRCMHIGTSTHRGAHSSPNLGQIPASRGSDLKKELGLKCRELFGPPKGYYQLGVDLSGIEVRLLAHYLVPYDKGRYVDIVMNGDVHWSNVLALGIFPEGTVYDEHNPDHNEARNGIAKTFLYAYMYGAGVAKLRSILRVKTEKQVKKMADQFDATIGLGGLKAAIQRKAKTEGMFKAIDKRTIFCDAQHKALNFLLQSAGGIVAKRWMVLVDRNLRKAGFSREDVAQMAWVHDELQLAVKNHIDPKVIQRIVEDSAIEAGEYYGMRIPINAEAKTGTNWSNCH